MKKYISIAFIMIVVIGAFMFSLGGSNNNLIGDGVRMTHLLVNGKPSGGGFLTVAYLGSEEKYPVINIAVDLNKDSAIKSYEVDGGIQEEWLVTNMYAQVIKGSKNNYSISIKDVELDSKTDLPVYVVLSENEIKDWSGEKVSGGIYKEILLSKIDTMDYGLLYSPDPEGERAGGSPLGSVLSNRVFADDAVNEYRTDVPDIDQGHNECVPTSIANSLLWLANKYKFLDKMPKGGDKDLIAELKSDLKWTKHGVWPEDVVPGIKTFIKRHKLLLEVHQIGETRDGGIVTKIAEELKKGRDVEGWLEYGKYLKNGSYVDDGAHMVTVVGVWTSPQGTKFIGLNDPLSQGDNATDVYQLSGVQILKYGFQGGYNAYLIAAFAESPISEEEVTPSVTIDSSSIKLIKETNPSGGAARTCLVTLSGTATGPECSYVTLQGGKPGTGSTMDMNGAKSCPDWSYWGTGGFCVRHLKQKNTTAWSTTFEASTYWGKTDLDFSIMLGTPKLPLEDLYGGNVCASTETDQKIYDTISLECK